MDRKEKTNPREKIKCITDNLFKTRERSDVVLRPYIKNDAQYMARCLCCEKETVDLERIIFFTLKEQYL